ncbi:MAG: dihydroxyacetone kinase subunit L [Propionibacterium sp.]|nr:dihydroxyacetone kinase subunit L [Propionibacterium sp.]
MGNELSIIQGWLSEARTAFNACATHLDELDDAIGDGDHGSNMSRGFEAASTMDYATFNTAAKALKQIGMTLLGTIGGASGSLYGTFFLTMASHWPSQVNAPRFAALLRAARDAVQATGRAEVGDKTMVDPLDAAVKAMEAAGDDAHLLDSLRAGVDAAQAARDATRDMVAKRGRAALLGEKSVGHIDPGAESMTLVLELSLRHLSDLG